jgi:transcription elongation factor GreA
MELPEELANRPPRSAGHEPTANLTIEAYLRLKAELEQLKTEGRTHTPNGSRRPVSTATSGRTPSTTSQERAGLMESRVQPERMLRDPDIIETPPASDVVAPGMLITLRPLEDDDPEDETYLLAESAEERAPGVRTMTTTSPLGKAVLGARLDDEVAYEAPAGTFHYLVVGFEPRT